MNILECKALTKRYGSRSALEGVELSIEPGRIVGLLGPNGSGKTTLIKLANGLLTPTSGEILIAGKAPCRATKAIVSYLPDRNTLPGWMTIAQALDYYGDFYSDFRRGVAEAMLMNLGLDRTQKIKTLSKGMREKTQLIPYDVDEAIRLNQQRGDLGTMFESEEDLTTFDEGTIRRDELVMKHASNAELMRATRNDMA